MNLVKPTAKNILIVLLGVGSSMYGFKYYLETYVAKKPSSSIQNNQSSEYQKFLNGQVKLNIANSVIETIRVERIVFNNDIKQIDPSAYLAGEANQIMKSGGNRVYFEISIRNNTQRELFYLGINFSIKTKDGEQLDPAGFQKGPTGTIYAGQSKRGWVVFNIMNGQIPEVLQYASEGNPFLRFSHLDKLPIFGGNQFESVLSDQFCTQPNSILLKTDGEKNKVSAECGEFKYLSKDKLNGSSIIWDENFKIIKTVQYENNNVIKEEKPQ